MIKYISTLRFSMTKVKKEERVKYILILKILIYVLV